MKVKPVMLPPGCDRLFTNPSPTGSFDERANDGNGAGHLLRSLDSRRTVCEYDVGRERDQLLAVLTDKLDFTARPTVFDLDVLAIFPAEVDQALLECRNALFTIGIAFGNRHQDAYLPAA